MASHRQYIEGARFTKDNIRCDGKVVIVTGCNTGIGKETVLDLAKRGARIYMACRDTEKCERARQDIITETGNKEIFNRKLDLNSLNSIRQFAKE